MNQPGKRQYWTSVIEKQTASGLSIPTFCKANDLSYPTFHYWLKKLTEQNDESQHAHTIVINDDIGTNTVALHSPNGIKAELPANLIQTQIKTWLQVLQ